MRTRTREWWTRPDWRSTILAASGPPSVTPSIRSSCSPRRTGTARPGFSSRGCGSRIASMGWEDWIRTVEVEPSLYAADFARLGIQIEVLLHAGARVFHFDVGDGHFVEPVTIGPVVP